jgi:hypothetical protein
VAARRLGIMLDKEIRKSFIGADPTTFRPPRAQVVYGAVDASILHQIREQQRREVQEQELGPTVALEMDVLPAIAAGGIVSESSADGPHDVPPRHAHGQRSDARVCPPEPAAGRQRVGLRNVPHVRDVVASGVGGSRPSLFTAALTDLATFKRRICCHPPTATPIRVHTAPR